MADLALKMLHPVFVHRVWECAGVDLLGVFDSPYTASVFATALMESGREPERTFLVSCNSYDGEMRRFVIPKPKEVSA